MYKIDDIGGLFISMPPNFQTDEIEAFCYAIDRQLNKIYPFAKKLNVWSDLDHADPNHYDMMAKTIDVPFYRSDLENEQKLNLIKSSSAFHKYAGTIYGIETILSSMFDEYEFVPWYMYNGRPYHFKVKASSKRTPEIDQLFLSILYRVKSARSVLDGIETVRTVDERLNIGASFSGYYLDKEIEQADMGTIYTLDQKATLAIAFDSYYKSKVIEQEDSEL